MARAEGGAALAASGSRRGGRGWPVVLCFGSRGGGTPWARRKRTVPVDGELVVASADDLEEEEEEEEAGKGPRARGCCFLPPARVLGRKDGKRGGGGSKTDHKHLQHERTKQKHARPQDDQNPPSQAPDVRRVETSVATTGVADARAPTRLPLPATTLERNDAAAKDVAPAPARECCTAAGGGAKAGGVGAFGPAVGPSVVAAVSMAGLLGGRLWAVVCVCAWLVALSRLSVTPCAGPGRHHGRE